MEPLVSNEFIQSACGYGERIKEERLRLKHTQAEFAALGFVSRPSQVHYEAEQRVPDLRYLAAIAELADVTFIVNGKRSNPALAESIDARSIQTILAAIESWTAESHLKITEDFRAELVALFIQQLVAHGNVNSALINNTLKLVRGLPNEPKRKNNV